MFRTSHISTEFVSNFGSVVLQEINCNVKTQRTQTTDAKWWQYPTLTFGPGELKKIKTEIYWKIFYFKYLYSIVHDHFRNIQSCKETINQLPHNTVFKLEQLLWLKWTVKPQRESHLISLSLRKFPIIQDVNTIIHFYFLTQFLQHFF